jgi:tetratricopeptide (TPR) repeat protein
MDSGPRPQPYDRVACDEVQDLAPPELQLITRLVKDSSIQNLFLTGDEAQVINPSGFRWSRLKGELGDRVSPLSVPDVVTFRKNYRSSSEIVNLVNAILIERQKLLDDEVSRLTQDSAGRVEQQPLALTSSPIGVIRETETNPDERLILVKTQEQKSELLAALGDSAAFVSVLTVEEAKGLEWSGVLLYNFFVPRNELISSNDWDSVFDVRKRNALIKELGSSGRNTYGLTYEFNLLHVGVTRARRFLAAYDESATMNIKGLGESVLPCVKDADPELFRIAWQTATPSAEDYRRLGDRLLERDTPQALNFFKLAALSFRRDGSYSSASECFERGRLYSDAADCARARGDKVEELRLLSRHEEARGRYTEAAAHQNQRGEILQQAGGRPSAADAFAEAARLYGLAKDPASRSGALLHRAEAAPSGPSTDKALFYVDAAQAACDLGQTQECVVRRQRALREVEKLGMTGSLQIGASSAYSWRAYQHLHTSRHFGDECHWSDAAFEAQTAAGLLNSASEQEGPAGSQKAQYGEQADAASAVAIDYLLRGEQYSKARVQRQELFARSRSRGQIEQRRVWWETWVKCYQDVGELDDFADSAVEVASMLSDRRLHTEAIRLLRDAGDSAKEGTSKRPLFRILDELVRISASASDRESQGMSMLSRGRFHEGEGDSQRAFDDYRQAGRLLISSSALDSGRSAFQSALLVAERLMKSRAIARFCLVDVSEEIMLPAGLPRDAFEWCSRAAGQFAIDAGSWELDLDQLLQRHDDSANELRRKIGAGGDEVRKREMERSLREELRAKAWTELCKSLTIYELSMTQAQGDLLARATPLAHHALDVLRGQLFADDAAEIEAGTRAWLR